jgi:hypothetical protein
LDKAFLKKLHWKVRFPEVKEFETPLEFIKALVREVVANSK